jgi:hypothetical protein
MSVEKEIRGNLNTTILSQLINIAVLGALLLTAIRGRLLSFVLKYGNAEYYAPAATESTPSSSKDTTQATKFRPASPRSQKATSLTYENPSDWINDIINGRIACNDVRMDHWIQLTTMAMVDNSVAHLNLDVPYRGGVYSFHHCIKQINPPAQTDNIMGVQH